MPNFKKYKKLKIGYLRSIPLKLLEYTRDRLRSKKFNNGTGKKIQLVDFINHVDSAEAMEVTNDYYRFIWQVGEKKVKFNLRKRSSDTFVYNQVIELEEYRFLVDFLEDKKAEYVFLDIGANVGLSTLYLNAYFPHAKIYCFEPEPTNFAALMLNIEMNQLKNVTAFNQGLYISDGALFANRSFRDSELWSFKLNAESAEGDKEKMGVVSFSTLMKNCQVSLIDFMKIDIEGGELPLLKDADFLKGIRENVKIIMIEIHPEVISNKEAKEILRNAGFLVFDVGGSSVGLNKHLGLNSKG